jgi:6-phosphogluconolactonase (cycloisomerase 2 family)
MSSSMMAGVSQDEALESHRLEREVIWDIPVLDTLAMWKRSMGKVGSGKLRYEIAYTNNDVQTYNVTERYHQKVMQNQTREFNVASGQWVNKTVNFTVYGNWTRVVHQTTKIAGLGNPIDQVMSLDGHWLYVITGYYSTYTTYSSSITVCTQSADCWLKRGYLTSFKVFPERGHVLFKSTQRLYTGGPTAPQASSNAANLQKVVMSSDGKYMYIIEADVGVIYSVRINAFTGVTTVFDTIYNCKAATLLLCEGAANPSSQYMKSLSDVALSPDGLSLYVTSPLGQRVIAYSRDKTTGYLSYQTAYAPLGATVPPTRYPTALAISHDSMNVYVGTISQNPNTLAARSTTSGQLWMYTRSTGRKNDKGAVGTLTLIAIPSNAVYGNYGWTKVTVSAQFDPITNPLEKDTSLPTPKSRINFPRCILMDPTDQYVYVASYSNSRVIAYLRDPKSGVLLYKTSAANKDNFLANPSTAVAGSQTAGPGVATYDALGPLRYPINMAISGDGGSLYVVSDVNDQVGVIKIESRVWLAPSAQPTMLPTPSVKRVKANYVDKMSYSDNLTCSALSCKSIWPKLLPDYPQAATDSPAVCGASCFAEDGVCKAGSHGCAFNFLEHISDVLNTTVVKETEAVTWQSADEYCQDHGARLCTADEIIYKEVAGTGCWRDTDLVWTSSQCDLSVTPLTGVVHTYKTGHWAIAERARNVNDPALAVCLNDTSVSAKLVKNKFVVTPTRVSCCADVTCGGLTPSPTKTTAPTPKLPTKKPQGRPTHKPIRKPTPMPSAGGWDVKLTYQEAYRNYALLHNPNGLVISPDWTNVYVVGQGSNSIVVLTRNATTPNPTGAPSRPPSPAPTPVPSSVPTYRPTHAPTHRPTEQPTKLPTIVPSPLPTAQPTPLPTAQPTPVPTTPDPSQVPTPVPSPYPTKTPTSLPTGRPTRVPFPEPTPQPSPLPTIKPTHIPTPYPSKTPTPLPTTYPTKLPTPSPTTAYPSQIPTPTPTMVPLWYLRPLNNSEWCWTLPKADTPSGYRNGLVPILARCVHSNAQKWSFDVHKKEIHPQNALDWCLDSDFDKSVRRPITVFRCGKTFSVKADAGHQQWDWDFPNSGVLKNAATQRCAATGKEMYQGRYIQAWFCDDTNQAWDFVAAEPE